MYTLVSVGVLCFMHLIWCFTLLFVTLLENRKHYTRRQHSILDIIVKILKLASEKSPPDSENGRTDIWTSAMDRANINSKRTEWKSGEQTWLQNFCISKQKWQQMNKMRRYFQLKNAPRVTYFYMFCPVEYFKSKNIIFCFLTLITARVTTSLFSNRLFHSTGCI